MEAEAATQSRLIGAILVENGLITREQLLRALEIQDETGERLGEIVVAEFAVPRIELASILAEQWAALDGNPSGGGVSTAPVVRAVATPAQTDPTTRRPIGEIFLELGVITTAQLDAALEEQRATGQRVGEILVEQGSLTRLDLASALAEQWSALEKLRPPSPATNRRHITLVAEPVPSAPVADGGALRALEERLAALEEATASGPASAGADLPELRATLVTLESRIETALAGNAAGEDLAAVAATLETRISALEQEDFSVELVAVRRELDDVRSQSNAGEAIAEARSAVDLLEQRLEQRPDPSAHIDALAADIAALAARIDGLPTVGDLERRVEHVATKAEFAGSDVLRLSERLEALSGLEQRLDVLAARVPTEGAIDGVIAMFRDELATIALRQESDPGRGDLAAVASIAARLDELAARLDSFPAPPPAELGPSLDALVERVEAMAATAATQLDGVGERMASLEGSAREGDGALERLATDLEELSTRTSERLDELGARSADSASLDATQKQLDELAGSLAHTAVAAPLEDLAARMVELAAQVDTITVLEERIRELERGLDAGSSTAELREEIRLVAESTAAERESLSEALMTRVEDILASGPRGNELEELRARVAGLDSLRVADALASGTRFGGIEASLESLADRGASVDAVAASIDARTGELAKRFDDLADGAADLVRRNELDAAAARHVEWVRSELNARDEAGDARVGQLEATLTEFDRARLAAELEGRSHVDESVASMWSVLEERRVALEPQLLALSTDVVELRAQVAELRDSRTSLEEMEGRIEARIAAQVAAVRVVADQEVAFARGEAISLGLRVDELVALRHTDIQAARAADGRLLEQVEALTGRVDDEQESSRSVVAGLSARLEAVASSVGADAAAALGAAEKTEMHVAELQLLRADDAAAAEHAANELAARLDDLAVRLAASAVEVEHALRSDLDSLGARFEEFDGASIEAREELRGELERLAASVGWRLEKVEESLATDDSAALRATVTGVELRLEAQAAFGDEQVRATERALRKGLASLGERLVDSESAYLEAGNTLRRSIERLGAAVVEADARMADQIPVSPLEGCVAFAPTADGYRLVEMPGAPPEVGAIVELVAGEGPLVVTRYGRSPLPFDGRPCAYLDRG